MEWDLGPNQHTMAAFGQPLFVHHGANHHKNGTSQGANKHLQEGYMAFQGLMCTPTVPK